MEEKKHRKSQKRCRNDMDTSFEWRCYPTKRPYPYKVGEKVLVRTKDSQVRYVLGTIQSIDSKDGGITLRTESGATASTEDNNGSYLTHLRDSRRLMPYFKNRELPTILVTSETTPFRQLASQIDEKDIVLEIGCSSGETSRILLHRAKSWVGFDTSEEMLKLCARYLPDDPAGSSVTKAVKIDGLVDPVKAREEATTFGIPNIIFIDIGGNREKLGVLRMLSWALQSFEKTEMIVIKSRELFHSIHSSNKVDKLTGVFDGQTWFGAQEVKNAKPKHPLRAPLVLSPKDNATPICRYHNYHEMGCHRSGCEFDHEHCHNCLQKDHIGRFCPGFK